MATTHQRCATMKRKNAASGPFGIAGEEDPSPSLVMRGAYTSPRALLRLARGAHSVADCHEVTMVSHVSRAARFAVLSLLLLSLAGCAHALKAPPAASEVLGEAAGHGPGDVDGLLEKGNALFAQRTLPSAAQALADFKTAAAADPERIEALQRAIAVWIWLTDHEQEPAARLDAATRAVDAAQLCARRRPEDVACDYWLGAGLGVQARERPSTGLSALPLIEASFKKAAARAPELEEAGPDRALALLYLRAPGWPTGPGDPELGLQHARRAVAQMPDYPPNHLALGEALSKSGDDEASRAAYRKARELARAITGPREPEAREWLAEANQALGDAGSAP